MTRRLPFPSTLTFAAALVLLTPAGGGPVALAAGVVPDEDGVLRLGPSDSIPTITLEEALERAGRLDPAYVAAVRQVSDARWNWRAAVSAFVLPSVSAQLSATSYSNQFFNIGTGEPASEIVDARLEGSLNLFNGFSKVYDLKRANAELEGARAAELLARFTTGLFTEVDFFDLLAQHELERVVSERVGRATEQLAVARARVIAGAAVQTDSLQLLLELTEARLELLRQSSRRRVAQYQLGRRVGVAGPVDAVLAEPLEAPDLPLLEGEAVEEALESSPQILTARADERAAEALAKSARGSYLPSLELFGRITSTDETFFPDAVTRNAVGLRVSLPIWNGAQREIAVSRANTTLEVARATRSDLERSLRRDVVEAYEAYEAARAAQELAAQAVLVARENLRVQQERYRAGATTILDLLSADVRLAEAEAGLVQARYTTRLALSTLEAILGRKLL